MKPTDNELEMAIVAAERMCATGDDEHHVAATLLYLYERLQVLEGVRAAARDFLHSGQEDPRYDLLVRALENASQ